MTREDLRWGAVLAPKSLYENGTPVGTRCANSGCSR